MAVIPARYGSSRVPGKALALIDGLPLVEHVRRRVALATEVIVATDDARIADLVRSFGGDARITGPAANGTHRVAALDLDTEYVLNVQCDQPGLDPAHVTAVIDLLRAGATIATLAVPVTDPREAASEAVVKVVLDDRGDALYFSRLPVPRGGPWLRHLGIYGFTADALRRAAAAPLGGPARAEDLEQLAWMAAGLRVRVGLAPSAAFALDTPEQLRTWTSPRSA